MNKSYRGPLRLLGLFFFSNISFYAHAAGQVDIVAIRNKHEAMVQKIKGVQMTSIALCDPTTGGRASLDHDGPRERCVLVGLDYQESLNNVQTVFSMPLRIEGVLFGFEVFGKHRVRPE